MNLAFAFLPTSAHFGVFAFTREQAWSHSSCPRLTPRIRMWRVCVFFAIFVRVTSRQPQAWDNMHTIHTKTVAILAFHDVSHEWSLSWLCRYLQTSVVSRAMPSSVTANTAAGCAFDDFRRSVIEITMSDCTKQEERVILVTCAGKLSCKSTHWRSTWPKTLDLTRPPLGTGNVL